MLCAEQSKFTDRIVGALPGRALVWALLEGADFRSAASRSASHSRVADARRNPALADLSAEFGRAADRPAQNSPSAASKRAARVPLLRLRPSRHPRSLSGVRDVANAE